MNVLVGRAPTRTGTAFDFMRQRIPLDDAQVEEWESNVRMLAGRLIEDITVHQCFPLHRCSCIGRYGKCDYFELDTLRNDVRDTIMNGDGFQDIGASPLEEIV
jgi:hypothetical protein